MLKRTIFCVIFYCIFFSIFADSTASLNNAKVSYDAGKYETALQWYREAQSEQPSESTAAWIKFLEKKTSVTYLTDTAEEATAENIDNAKITILKPQKNTSSENIGRGDGYNGIKWGTELSNLKKVSESEYADNECSGSMVHFKNIEDYLKAEDASVIKFTYIEGDYIEELKEYNANCLSVESGEDTYWFFYNRFCAVSANLDGSLISEYIKSLTSKYGEMVSKKSFVCDYSDKKITEAYAMLNNFSKLLDTAAGGNGKDVIQNPYIFKIKMYQWKKKETRIILISQNTSYGNSVEIYYFNDPIIEQLILARKAAIQNYKNKVIREEKEAKQKLLDENLEKIK